MDQDQNNRRGGLFMKSYPWLWAVVVFITGSGVFFLLRGLAIPGGDTILLVGEGWDYWQYLWHSEKLIYYAREPLAHLIVLKLYQWTGDIPLAFQILSALSGGVYLVLMLSISRRPVFLAINFCSVTIFLFIGHLEYYGPICVALTLYLWTLVKALQPDPKVGPVHVAAALCLAWFCHNMVIFYAPLVVWLLVARSGERWRRRRGWSRRQWEWALGIVIGAFVLHTLPSLINLFDTSWILYILKSQKPYELIIPPTQGLADAIYARSQTGIFFHFTLFEWAHVKLFLFFWVISAPLGLLLLILMRKRIQSDAARMLVTAFVISVAWTFVWHPQSLHLDWDLFCLGAIPVNLLAGGLAAGVLGDNRENENDTER